MNALIQEIALRHNYLEGQPIETIYWGGGTPSLLPTEDIMRLWDTIERHFNLAGLKEITLEANPDDLSQQYLKALRHTPVNRLSIGIQSFHDADLIYMNRAHNAGEADYAIKAAQDHGFEQISIDLIYGTPTLNNEQWQNNLHQAVQLQVPHISSYALTIEPKTALAHAIRKGTTKEPEQDTIAMQFHILTDTLQAAGFDHYEISNFALPGQYALHNTNYWKNKTYLGIGPSAHSFNGTSRQWNIAHNPQYIKSILTDKKIPAEVEYLSFSNRFNEYLMTSLRTMWGTDLAYVEKEFGRDRSRKLLEDSLVFREREWILLKEETLVLTEKGKLFADGIAAELFIDELL